MSISNVSFEYMIIFCLYKENWETGISPVTVAFCICTIAEKRIRQHILFSSIFLYQNLNLVFNKRKFMLISPFSTGHRTTLTKTILQYEYCNSMQMCGMFIKTERKETTGTCFIHGLSFLTNTTRCLAWDRTPLASVCFISINYIFTLIFLIQFALWGLFLLADPFSATHTGFNCYINCTYIICQGLLLEDISISGCTLPMLLTEHYHVLTLLMSQLYHV